MQLQSVLLIVLPVFTPLIGSSVAAVLAQDHWPVWLNDGLAWFFLLFFAGLDLYANNQLSGGWVVIVADGVSIVMLLSSGWLIKLSPWLIWLAWLQSNVFNLVPLFEQANKAPTPPTPTQSVTTRAYTPPTPIVLPTQSPVPPRASAGQQEPGSK